VDRMRHRLETWQTNRNNNRRVAGDNAEQAQ